MKTETRSFYETAVERTIARIADMLDEAIDLHALANAPEDAVEDRVTTSSARTARASP